MLTRQHRVQARVADSASCGPGSYPLRKRHGRWERIPFVSASCGPDSYSLRKRHGRWERVPFRLRNVDKITTKITRRRREIVHLKTPDFAARVHFFVIWHFVVRRLVQRQKAIRSIHDPHGIATQFDWNRIVHFPKERQCTIGVEVSYRPSIHQSCDAQDHPVVCASMFPILRLRKYRRAV